MSISLSAFGKAADGRVATLYTLKNKSGAYITLCDFGARVVSIYVPDRDGKLADVNIGFDEVAPYIAHGGPSIGATIGRVGNRIGGAKFTLNGTEYKVPMNDGVNSLHGGEETAEQAETPEVAEDIEGWQRITPKEVAGSKRLWKYAKNPFVTAEFNKFKHLLYREDEKFCFLAVPCMQNERFAGAAQGFRMFERHGGNDYAILKCEK